jgi:hypothetical protein
MLKKLLIVLLFAIAWINLPAAASDQNLRDQWMVFDGTEYKNLDSLPHPKLTTIYVRIEAHKHPKALLKVASGETFFLFINGQLVAETKGLITLSLDSLAGQHHSPSLLVGVYQEKINERELTLSLVTRGHRAAEVLLVERPATWFRDFVISAGLIIILIFLLISRLNPKLASDYFSVVKIFSLREADDIQATARLTSSTNIQFYIGCSLLLGYYLIILFHHLPKDYAVPIRFPAYSFGSAIWQWIKLSSIIFGFFFAKVTLIFALTRLFSMRGMARIHFFNWVRLMLIVFGAGSIIVFLYFINRGQHASFFVVFLSLVNVTLIAWVLLAFLKLNGKSEHSLFHLFSYICATEIIPLLITVKVLYQ